MLTAPSTSKPRRGRPPKVQSPLVEPAAEPVVEAHASPPPAPKPAPKPTPKPALKFKARRAPIRHPYQGVMIPLDRGVPLVLDSWVEVQLAAKVIEYA
jgi:hypothetical protein